MKACTDKKYSEKKYGDRMFEKLQQRTNEISSAGTVEEMVQYKIGKCHPLTNNRKGQYAVDLVQPYRLIFDIHKDSIQIANIIEITDYH